MTKQVGRLGALMTAVALVAAAVLGLSVPFSPAATAAYCTTSGIGVVVDATALGGSVDTYCGKGSVASDAFTSAGVSLSDDPQHPGFVCRVDGMPAVGVDCNNANAYWALYISRDDKSWVYASQGVYTQGVSAGQSIAFVWQRTSSQRGPGVAPQAPIAPPKATAGPTKAASSTPKPKPKPTRKPTKAPKPSASTTPSVTPSVTASASPSATPSASDLPAKATSSVAATPTLAATPLATPTDEPVPSAATATDRSAGGLPGWVAIVVIVALAAAAAATGVIRRRLR